MIVSKKTSDSAKVQGYFILQAENATDFNSISIGDMDWQSVNNENPGAIYSDENKEPD
jgi:hypothetical protein